VPAWLPDHAPIQPSLSGPLCGFALAFGVIGRGSFCGLPLSPSRCRDQAERYRPLPDAFARQFRIGHGTQPSFLTVLQVRRIRLSALALDKLLGNLHHGRIRFGIRHGIKDRSCVVDVALLVEGLSDQTALGRAQGDGAFSLGDHHPRQGDTTRFLNRLTRLSQLVAANPSSWRFSGVWRHKVGTTAWVVIVMPERRLR
jgi:hypothetical protein